MKRGPTNPITRDTARTLERTGKGIWSVVAGKITSPTRRRSEVNLFKIDSLTKKGDMVAVPGKVLGDGELTHAVSVAALNFSSAAKKKIEAAGGKCLTLQEIAKTDGKNVIILG